MVFLSKTVVENPSVDSTWAGAITLLPRNIQLTTNSGANRFTTEGKNRPWIIASGVICPPIQSMVVVTSPMGDHAPPAFAAITIIPAKNNLSSRLSRSLRTKEIITIVVVKLSKIELRKKATQQIIHSNIGKLCVLILAVTTSKPWCASTTSTMAMAAIKKKTICAVPIKLVDNSWLICA